MFSYNAGRVPGNKGQTYTPTLLTTGDVRALMDAAGSGAYADRSRGFIGMAYRTGATPQEMLGLRLTDLDMTPRQETISVEGKKRTIHHRVLALDGFALDALKPWLHVRGRLPGDHLFCVIEGRTSGGQWQSSDVRTRLHALARRAGLAETRVHVLAFRHSLVAELMIEQWPIPYIMRQLGIVSLTSFEGIFRHLGIEPPPDAEVIECARTRPLPADDAP